MAKRRINKPKPWIVSDPGNHQSAPQFVQTLTDQDRNFLLMVARESSDTSVVEMAQWAINAETHRLLILARASDLQMMKSLPDADKIQAEMVRDVTTLREKNKLEDAKAELDREKTPRAGTCREVENARQVLEDAIKSL